MYRVVPGSRVYPGQYRVVQGRPMSPGQVVQGRPMSPGQVVQERVMQHQVVQERVMQHQVVQGRPKSSTGWSKDVRRAVQGGPGAGRVHQSLSVYHPGDLGHSANSTFSLPETRGTRYSRTSATIPSLVRIWASLPASIQSSIRSVPRVMSGPVPSCRRILTTRAKTAKRDLPPGMRRPPRAQSVIPAPAPILHCRLQTHGRQDAAR